MNSVLKLVALGAALKLCVDMAKDIDIKEVSRFMKREMAKEQKKKAPHRKKKKALNT